MSGYRRSGSLLFDSTGALAGYVDASGNEVMGGFGGGGVPAAATPLALAASAAVGVSTKYMREDAVLPLPSALQVGGVPQISGNYNASTNTVLTGPLTGYQPISSTVPTGGPPAFRVTVAGTPGLDSVGALNVGDDLFQTGTVWDVAYGVAPTLAIKKGNGTGGLADAVASTDYGPPINFQNAVEVFAPCSGSIGNNGALTLGTALDKVYSDGCWMSFPIGAIATGIPASSSTKYFVQMSTTTVGQIFNNTYIPGTSLPTVPASPTAFVTTGPGAYTQVTSGVPAFQYVVPANSMGPNGSIDIELWIRGNSTAGNKTVSALFGGQLGPALTLTSGQQQTNLSNILNKGNAKKQKCNNSGRYTSGNAGNGVGTVDTTVAQNLIINVQLAVATDWACIDYVRITINYGA